VQCGWCGAEHLTKQRVEGAQLRKLGGVRALSALALNAILLLRWQMLVRVQYRVRETYMLSQKQKRACELKQGSFGVQWPLGHG
jgi:hypothetical protein